MTRGPALFKTNPFLVLILTTPVILPFTCLYFLAKGLIWAVKKVPWSINLVPILLQLSLLIAVKTCRLAHNNGRLASFVGVSFGALIGLMAGHLLVAAITGAMIGAGAHFLGSHFTERDIFTLKEQYQKMKSEAF